MDPAKALRLIGFYLERAGEPTFKVQAFRKAAAIMDDLPDEEVQQRAKRGSKHDPKLNIESWRLVN
jgi:putative hydrolase